MRALLLTLALSFTPALAHAGIDYKCSDEAQDQVAGWLRFDFGGANGQVEIEYWNGYPPVIIVDAKIDSVAANDQGGKRITSVPDVEEGAVATIDVPSDYASSDKFSAATVVKYRSPETKQMVTMKYNFSCVRQ